MYEKRIFFIPYIRSYHLSLTGITYKLRDDKDAILLALPAYNACFLIMFHHVRTTFVSFS